MTPASRSRLAPRSAGHDLSDEHGVREAYAAHGSELYRFAARLLGDSALAEEAVQETFLRAWRAAGRYDRSIGSLRNWLFAIARNVVIDLSRSRAAAPHPTGEIGEQAEEDPVEQVLVTWQVEEALRRVGDDHRVAIVETYYRGRPHKEVAAELKIPEGTLRSRIFYGLKALRLALEEMGWGDES